MSEKIYLIGKPTCNGPLYMGYTDDKKIAKIFKTRRKGFEIIKIDPEDIPEDQLNGEEIIEIVTDEKFRPEQCIFESEEEVLVSNYYEMLYDIPTVIKEFKKVLKYVKCDIHRVQPLLDELNYIYNSLRHDDMNGDMEEYINFEKFAEFFIKEVLDN